MDRALRILVAIAYYGDTNEEFVHRLIGEYRSLKARTHIALLTERAKPIDGVEQVIGLPTPNPYSLPFAHKRLFADRRDDFDLFVYSEDDTLVQQRNIDAFLWASSVLPEPLIAGFLRTERARDGSLRCSSVHTHFHWDPGSAREIAGEVFAHFTNPHGAAYLLTQEQLKRVIDSGGFLTEPGQGRLDMRVTAATDPYTRCGLQKMVCATRLDDFLLPHLSNRYHDSLGIPLDEFKEQTHALCEVAQGTRTAARLYDPTTHLETSQYDARFYGVQPPQAARALRPPYARRILSVGTGSGQAEETLSDGGAEVIGIPLDDIISLSAARRGLTLMPPALDAADSYADGGFDALVAFDGIHHFRSPTSTLRRMRRLIRPGGSLLATFPDVRRDQLRAVLRADVRLARSLTAGYETTGVHLLPVPTYTDWLRQAGFSEVQVRYEKGRGQSLARSALGPRMAVVSAQRGPLRSPRTRGGGSRVTVSIGVPVYNGEAYLRQALDSIRNQDFEDFEVIICDNASTDKTELICRDFVASDSRFQYHRQETNLGAAANYNDTFVRSKGEFFTWLPHDDLRGPHFLRACLDEFEAGSRSVVVAHPRTDFIDHEGRRIGPDLHRVDARQPSPARRLAQAVTHTGAVNAIFGLIDSRALEQTRLIGPFVASDRVLLAELALLGGIHQVPQTLSFRRLHESTSTSANPGKRERTQWFAPEARPSRLSEPQMLAREYVRSVLEMEMRPSETMACLATVPIVMGARRGRIAAGRYKRRLRGQPESDFHAWTDAIRSRSSAIDARAQAR